MKPPELLKAARAIRDDIRKLKCNCTGDLWACERCSNLNRIQPIIRHYDYRASKRRHTARAGTRGDANE